jgi:hypothetical protein
MTDRIWDFPSSIPMNAERANAITLAVSHIFSIKLLFILKYDKARFNRLK